MVIGKVIFSTNRW